MEGEEEEKGEERGGDVIVNIVSTDTKALALAVWVQIIS